jgi:tRNA threonylcarbamoyladenosine biosynthesis protein TsaB
MKTVAIDTSLPEGSVAASDGQTIAEVRFAPAQTHARRIAAALQEATARLGWRLADAELVAVVRGPGSFTGLRVGIATAKGIAWAGGGALVSLSGFEVIAAGGSFPAADPDGPLHVAFDAGRGDLFVSEVARDPASPLGWTAAAGVLLPADDWIATLPVAGRVSGPALDLDRLAALLATRPDLHVAPADARRPGAAAAAILAVRLAAAGRTVDARDLTPEYSRPSYVQENDPRPSR